MGNSPSTSKTPASISQSQSLANSSSQQRESQNESPRPPVRRDNRHPIPVQNHRVAAPPEPSLTQAQGTAVQPPTNSSNRPRSFHSRMGPSQSSSSTSSSAATGSVTPARPVDVRHAGRQDQSSHEPSRPVAVPSSSHQSPTSPRSPRSPDIYESATLPHSSLQDISYLTRPPRLPLPIEEEVHTPGSPIIAPTDIGQPLEDLDGLESEGSGLARPSSTLSNSSTVEDEDAEELRVDKSGPTVPTRLEWRRGGDKVYVTGTIFQWNRKTRLHPVEGRPGVFAATINILPGTHHVRFLVDGQMQTSPDLPTTVDFGNNLVNYIEVNPDDLPSKPTQTSGVPIGKGAQKSLQSQSEPVEGEESKAPRDRIVPPPELFAHKIPKYLLDFDQPDDTPVYHNAVAAIDKLQNPPALPGFLGKPILNAATLIKDDNSVLNMPNHTVLNHLATSSIKNNILAVSATTRYKNKYVTTIMYKPTTNEGI